MVKSILKELHSIKGFVYASVRRDPFVEEVLRIEVRERKGRRGRCSGCGVQPSAGDQSPDWRITSLVVATHLPGAFPPFALLLHCKMRAQKVEASHNCFQKIAIQLE